MRKTSKDAAIITVLTAVGLAPINIQGSGRSMYLEFIKFKAKICVFVDWEGSEGTAGWFAIIMHFRKLQPPHL